MLTGAGFVTLAATLSIIPDIPIQSLAIIVGIDKFMSECRALTNLVGNGSALRESMHVRVSFPTSDNSWLPLVGRLGYRPLGRASCPMERSSA